MILILFLKQKGLVTGPLPKHTSHSAMATTLTILCGESPFEGDVKFLIFGNALHTRLADPTSDAGKDMLPTETIKLIRMLSKVNAHPVVKRLTQGAEREQKLFTELNGVKITYILDVHQRLQRIGTDYKSTVCKTLEEVIESCRKYRYFNQAVIYKKAEKLKKFYFVFICKEPPYPMFIVDIDDYPEDMTYAECEVSFSLYFYKHYGKANYIRKDNGQSSGTRPAKNNVATVPVTPIGAEPVEKIQRSKAKTPAKRKGLR